MADAAAAFGEAFASYKKNARDFIIYSIAMGVASAILGGILLLMLAVAGVISIGSIAGLFAPGAGLSVGLLGFGTTLLVLAIGLLIFAWVSSGLNGSYFETLSMIMAGKKQTMGAFFKAIPRLATPLLAVGILQGLIIGIPVIAIALLFSLGGSILSILGVFIAIAYAIVMSLLLMFAIPGVVVDHRSAVSAVRYSLSAAPRHFMGIIIYLAISTVLILPGFILNVFYIDLFYMPLTGAALLLLYKKAK